MQKTCHRKVARFLYKKRTGEAYASPGKLSNYLYLRFLAASDFFFLFTLGFS